MPDALGGRRDSPRLGRGAVGDPVLPGDRDPGAEPGRAAVARVRAQLPPPAVGHDVVARRRPRPGLAVDRAGIPRDVVARERQHPAAAGGEIRAERLDGIRDRLRQRVDHRRIAGVGDHRERRSRRQDGAGQGTDLHAGTTELLRGELGGVFVAERLEPTADRGEVARIGGRAEAPAVEARERDRGRAADPGIDQRERAVRLGLGPPAGDERGHVLDARFQRPRADDA